VLPCVDVFVADEFFVWAPISRARLVLRFGAPVKDSLRFWAPIWPTRLAFPQKPHVSSPPHLCCWPLRISWLGAPLGDSTRFWSPLWPTRLAFPLETPSFFPTAPLSLALSVLLVGRSSCRLASVLGSHFADSPCVPAGNPKFFPHRTSFAGSLGFVGSALPLATRLGFGRPFGRLALRSLWKPQVFSLPRLCRCSLGFVGWALLLATRLGFERPSGRLASVLGAPLADSPCVPSGNLKFFPHRPSVSVLSVLLVGRSSCRLVSVLGAPLGDSPCIPSGNPKFFPHRALCGCSFGFVGWALLCPTRPGFGRPSGRLASVLGSPLADSPCVPSGNLKFFPHRATVAVLSVLLVGRSSCRLASVLGAPLADSPSVPSGNPKFFPHRATVAVLSVLLVGRSSGRLASVLGAPLADSPRFWAPLWPTRLGFGRPSGRLALRSVWKPQVFSPPRHCRCSFGFVGWALLLPTRLGFGRPSGRLAFRSVWKPQVFSPPRHCRCSLGFVGWALFWPTRLGFGRPSGRLASVLGAPLADSPCVPSGDLKFFPHRATVAVLSVLLVGRSSCRLASVLGAPLADSPSVPSGNPKFFPHLATVVVLSVLLVGRSSWPLASVLGAPLAGSPCVPS
jgi:hypothetical protein